MVKTADMTREYGDLKGWTVAQEMRRIMTLDLDEIDIRTQVQIYQAELSTEDQLAANLHLNPSERRGWKDYLRYEEWCRHERLKHVD